MEVQSQLKKRVNKKLASERVIIENFFGGMANRYKIRASVFRSQREDFYLYFETYCALINYEIIQCNSPLRSDDSTFYQKFITQFSKEGFVKNELKEQKKSNIKR